MELEEKVLTLSRPFELASLNEAFKEAAQPHKLADEKHNIPEQEAKSPHAIQVSPLVLSRLPEILKIKDNRTEEEKDLNTNPYKFKDIEVKQVKHLESNQMKFITNANDGQNVMLEFYGEKGEQFS